MHHCPATLCTSVVSQCSSHCFLPGPSEGSRMEGKPACDATGTMYMSLTVGPELPLTTPHLSRLFRYLNSWLYKSSSWRPADSKRTMAMSCENKVHSVINILMSAVSLHHHHHCNVYTKILSWTRWGQQSLYSLAYDNVNTSYLIVYHLVKWIILLGGYFTVNKYCPNRTNSTYIFKLPKVTSCYR